ncbi:hypothetical protein MOQ72_09280 [Saccharopolyspora sp. K220]|uniref:hypothetical protein n=1 Tax=Saccharopolyspora soli TaxID=2926618 RepID=UPI001F57131F|nr:hypothetical protein [Saccharopolyspora soli]MCI2417617.1 hypothetical protein [Saccharopolyspora soli]
MGLFDWMSGTKHPPGGVAPRSAEDVRAALLAVNGPDRPFVVRDGQADGVDLVAEWKIADAQWFGYFGNVTTVNRTLMRLNPGKNEVRAVDQEWSVTWIGDSPRLTLASEFSRGQINKKSFVTSLSRDEHGNVVKTTRTFSTNDLKPPLRDAVTGSGWVWRGLLIGKL